MIVEKSNYKILEAEMKKTQFFTSYAISPKFKERLLMLCNTPNRISELVWKMIKKFDNVEVYPAITTFEETLQQKSFVYFYVNAEKDLIRGICDQFVNEKIGAFTLNIQETAFPTKEFKVTHELLKEGTERLVFQDNLRKCLYRNGAGILASISYDKFNCCTQDYEEPQNG